MHDNKSTAILRFFLKTITRTRNIAIIAGLLFCIAGVFFLFHPGLLPLSRVPSSSSGPYVITLTEQGFSPSMITIHQGDTVTFSSSLASPFWPASDLHPSHLIYPEFDPKQPIESGQTWRFRFDKAGKWNFHDHLAPLFRGIIVVEGEGTKLSASALLLDDCNGKEVYGQKAQCWETVIDYVLKEEGLDRAFEMLGKAAETNPQFAADCHGLSHRLGETAYDLFAQGKDVALSPKSSYCAYGFYHGFMEKLLHATNDMKQAQAFCAYAEQKLAGHTSDAGGACYHGIGHGLVADVPSPRVWGNAQGIVDPVLRLCESVAPDEANLFRCTSGAFNALEIISSANQYKLSLNTADPFLICRTQLSRYKNACYSQFVVAALNAGHSDFFKTAAFINTIPEDEYALPALAALAVEQVRLGQTDIQKIADACRMLAPRFHQVCISGFAEGFLKYGPPKQEYVRAVNVCRSPILSEAERSGCFARILSILPIWYSKEKSRDICLAQPTNYQWQNCDYH